MRAAQCIAALRSPILKEKTNSRIFMKAPEKQSF